jgi:hypothetical protein
MWPDVFAPDLFTTTALTAAINEQAYQPGLLRDLGLFSVDGVSTLTVIIERDKDLLTLVQTSERGGPGTPRERKSKRDALSFIIPHLKQPGAIMADSVQGVREFGTTDQHQTVENERDKELARMARDLDFTQEYHRLGAVQGKVLDADGTTVLIDLFEAFDIAEPAAVDFNLDAADPVDGAVMAKCHEITFDMEEALDGVPYTGIHALVDNGFFTAMTTHPEVRETYKYQQGIANREGRTNVPFEYGDIVWHRYRGRGACAIPANTARFFPVGVPDLFITRYGPADYIETVNTKGLPRYAKAEPMKMGRGIELEAQANPLHLCTRPKVLLKATKT